MFAEHSQMIAQVTFWMLAGIAVLCGIGVLVARHPIKGAVSLIGVMLSLAGIYALLHSPFIAVLQVLVYAGAIMMLLVFVIMILNQAEDHRLPRFDRLSLLGVALAVLLGAIVVLTVGRLAPGSLREDPMAVRSDVERIGAALVDTRGQAWWVLFEAGGLLLLAAVVGAVLLAKRSLASPGVEAAAESATSHIGHADRGPAVVLLHDHAAAAVETAVNDRASTVAEDPVVTPPGH